MISPEVLEKLAASGIELHLLSADGFDIVVKRPDRASYKRFRAMSLDPVKRAESLEQLVKDCLVHPDRAGFDAMLEARAAIGDVFAEKVLALAGMVGEAEAKKL